MNRIYLFGSRGCSSCAPSNQRLKLPGAHGASARATAGAVEKRKGIMFVFRGPDARSSTTILASSSNRLLHATQNTVTTGRRARMVPQDPVLHGRGPRPPPLTRSACGSSAARSRRNEPGTTPAVQPQGVGLRTDIRTGGRKIRAPSTERLRQRMKKHFDRLVRRSGTRRGHLTPGPRSCGCARTDLILQLNNDVRDVMHYGSSSPLDCVAGPI